jgi:hypothetical protein
MNILCRLGFHKIKNEKVELTKYAIDYYPYCEICGSRFEPYTATTFSLSIQRTKGE